MKSVFNKEISEELINRINLLTAEKKPQWGSMSVTQMVKHCVLCEEYYCGNIPMKRAFIGRVFGKMAIKMILKDENSGIKKNASTSASFKVTDSGGDLESGKVKWISLINDYETFNDEAFTHWFFGRMTKKQMGEFIYKHSDHHLKQFGV